MITPGFSSRWKFQPDFYFAAILRLKQEMELPEQKWFQQVLRNIDANRNFDTWFYDAGPK